MKLLDVLGLGISAYLMIGAYGKYKSGLPPDWDVFALGWTLLIIREIHDVVKGN